MILTISISIWILTGAKLGHLYALRLKKSHMTLNDLLLSALAGPMCVIGIYAHYQNHIIFAKDESASNPYEVQIQKKNLELSEAHAKIKAVMIENKEQMEHILKLQTEIASRTKIVKSTANGSKPITLEAVPT